MKVNKKLLENVAGGSGIAQVIACALYLNEKYGSNNVTIHGQVASLGLTGLQADKIAKKTGFDKNVVIGALADIAAFVGR